METTTLNRRQLLLSGGAALVSGAVAHAAGATAPRRRVALVGTGGRGIYSWAIPIQKELNDVLELVGLCDVNAKRVAVAKEMIGCAAPVYVDFDRMIRETKPEMIVVTTADSAHFLYIIRAMELGCDVLTEKPLCTDEEQLQAIVNAQRKTGKKLTVAHNARHFAGAKRVKQLLQEKAIGEVLSVNFHEYLDTNHGASYFRRWHRLREKSGTLLLHKSSHHFDQVNWWLDSEPIDVIAQGDLRFYGRNGRIRSTHCRACPFKTQCQFYFDIAKDKGATRLYANCESEDGYLYDGCIWREDTNIYDVNSVVTRYANGVLFTYTADCYLPYEGQEISFNGTKGRIDYNSYGGGGYHNEDLRLTKIFGKSEVIKDMPAQDSGEHGGADPSTRRLIFRGEGKPDPLGLRADLRAGAMAALIGIAGRTSIDRKGQRVKIRDLVERI